MKDLHINPREVVYGKCVDLAGMQDLSQDGGDAYRWKFGVGSAHQHLAQQPKYQQEVQWSVLSGEM
jgi:hypothetical protein